MQSSSRPTDAAATVKLRVVESPVAGLAGQELVLDAGGELLIGRADDCGLPVADPSISSIASSIAVSPTSSAFVRTMTGVAPLS